MKSKKLDEFMAQLQQQQLNETARSLIRPTAWILFLVTLAALVSTFVSYAESTGTGIMYGEQVASLSLTTTLPADGSVLRKGDLLRQLGGMSDPCLADVETLIAGLAEDDELDVRVDRPGEGVSVTASMRRVMPAATWLQEIPPAATVHRLLPGSPAWAAGIRPGDLVLAIDGIPLARPEAPDRVTRLLFKIASPTEPQLRGLHAVEREVRHSGGTPLRLSIWRSGEATEFAVSPGSQGTSREEIGTLIFVTLVLPIMFAMAIASASSRRNPWIRLFVGVSSALVWALTLMCVVQIRMSEETGLFPFLRDAGIWVCLLGVPWAASGTPLRHKSGFAPFVSLSLATALTWIAWRLHVANAFDHVLVRRQPESMDWALALRMKVFQPGQSPVLPLIMFWCFFAGLIHLIAVYWFAVRPLGSIERGARVDRPPDGPTSERENSRVIAVVLGVHAQLLDALKQACARTPDLDGRRRGLDGILDDVDDRHANAMSIVRWSEQALPLLGFLGTVIGIAGAMLTLAAVLTQEVVFDESGRLTQIVRAALDSAFDQMGFAFDTTFVGLAGVLIIGGLDLLVRGFYARAFSTVREFLEGELAAVGGTSASTELFVLQAQVAELKSAKDRIGRAMTQLILEGDGHPFEQMRSVLYRTAVRIDDVTLGDPVQRSKAIAEIAGANWRFTALGTPPSSAAAAVLCAQGKQGCAVVIVPRSDRQHGDQVIRIPDLGNVIEIVPSHDLSTCLFRTENGSSYVLGLGTTRPVTPAIPGPERIASFAVRSGDSTVVVQVSLTPGPLVLRSVDLRSGRSGNYEVTSGGRWERATMHQDGSAYTLFAVDQGAGGATVHRIELTRSDGSLVELHRLETHALLLPGVTIASIAATGASEVVLFDAAQRLYSVHWGRGPVMRTWKHGEPQALFTGGGPWFVVISGTRLHVRRVAYVKDELMRPPLPYADFQVGGTVLDHASWRTTSDGRVILAFGPQMLHAWTFPHTTL